MKIGGIKKDNGNPFQYILFDDEKYLPLQLVESSDIEYPNAHFEHTVFELQITQFEINISHF